MLELHFRAIHTPAIDRAKLKIEYANKKPQNAHTPQYIEITAYRIIWDCVRLCVL